MSAASASNSGRLTRAVLRPDRWLDGGIVRFFLFLVFTQSLYAAILVSMHGTALYEIDYELNNRPDWLHIPLAGMSRILQRRGV